MALVFYRYLLLVYEQRCQIDPRTLGNIFHACCDELICKLIEEFIEALPYKLRLCLKKCVTRLVKLLDDARIIDYFKVLWLLPSAKLVLRSLKASMVAEQYIAINLKE